MSEDKVMGSRERTLERKRKYTAVNLGQLFLLGVCAGMIFLYIIMPPAARIVSWRIARETTRDIAEGGRHVDLYDTANRRASARCAVLGSTLYELTPVRPYPEGMAAHYRNKKSDPLDYKVLTDKEYAELRRDTYVDFYFEINSKKKE